MTEYGIIWMVVSLPPGVAVTPGPGFGPIVGHAWIGSGAESMVGEWTELVVCGKIQIELVLKTSISRMPKGSLKTMPLSDEQLHRLYGIAKQHWLDAQAALYAYERDFKSSKRTSDWLKKGTIGSAAVTAVSAAVPGLPWITSVVGISTAIIASVDQMYSPNSNVQKYWDCRTQLEGIKKDLVTCASTIDESQDLLVGAEPFTQIGKRIPEIMAIPTDIHDEDRNRAASQFERTVIASLLDRGSDGHAEEVDDMDAPPEDAPDIVSAYRPRASG